MIFNFFSMAGKLRLRSAPLIIAAGVGIAAVTATTFPVSTAYAQFSDSFEFLEAVKKRDGQKATDMIDEPGAGAVLINTKDGSTGRTALHIVVEGRDTRWIGFLLQKGANPNVVDKKGNTPLMAATSLSFIEGVEWLTKYKADLNKQNRSGETALIRAVQLRKLPIVRFLIKAGANPDITDNLTGLSARDYASRDIRDSAILKAIEDGDKKADNADRTGGLDFSGIKEFSAE